MTRVIDGKLTSLMSRIWSAIISSIATNWSGRTLVPPTDRGRMSSKMAFLSPTMSSSKPACTVFDINGMLQKVRLGNHFTSRLRFSMRPGSLSCASRACSKEALPYWRVFLLTTKMRLCSGSAESSPILTRDLAANVAAKFCSACSVMLALATKTTSVATRAPMTLTSVLMGPNALLKPSQSITSMCICSKHTSCLTGALPVLSSTSASIFRKGTATMSMPFVTGSAASLDAKTPSFLSTWEAR
mmetsp:Transcript_86195/g.263855  ORF Transcript_86195/g.263855 Transcript_86195/m.263855 type:complete len:244 (-) Transcript_86195:234-965(-)